ncbi:methylated-DNA--[protein]-cysteine S-methyltransferase [Geminicoccaceae bacterium 1502E]|nr:methylated-DNA--[protein]-cysteine S-methyltransferase [Geminicoccaceae bacterium 1502E]
MSLLIDRIAHETGTIILVSDGRSLRALDYDEYEPRMMRLLRARCEDVRLVERDDPQGFSSRLRAYLAGALDAIEAIPVETGGTPFQQRVWQALRTIPAGSTRSYGALAALLGQAGASRAVGHANSLNPVAIVVPCHRVVGANGKLTGYAGGIERKRWLLAHEGASLDLPPRRPAA